MQPTIKPKRLIESWWWVACTMAGLALASKLLVPQSQRVAMRHSWISRVVLECSIQCWSWSTCWFHCICWVWCGQRRTCKVVSSWEWQRGQSAESHFFHQNIVTPTTEWLEANLDKHIWKVCGKAFVVLSRWAHCTRWNDLGSSWLWSVQYCRACYWPSVSSMGGWGLTVILLLLTEANHSSPVKASVGWGGAKGDLQSGKVIDRILTKTTIQTTCLYWWNDSKQK